MRMRLIYSIHPLENEIFYSSTSLIEIDIFHSSTSINLFFISIINRGQLNWTACENGFSYAADLVKYIRKNYGDYFCISVAGYPEGHIENPDKEADLKNLKKKVDSGADYIVTQLFYDVDLYLEWIQRCRNIGRFYLLLYIGRLG